MKQYTKEQLSVLVRETSKKVSEETTLELNSLLEKVKEIENAEQALFSALTLLYVQAQMNCERTIEEVLSEVLCA